MGHFNSFQDNRITTHARAPEAKKNNNNLKVKTLFTLEPFKFKQWVRVYLYVKKEC